MDERKINELKRIEELENIIRKNITEDLEFNNKLKFLMGSDYKLNSYEIFQLIYNKFDETSNERAELWFLETFKNLAYIEDVLKQIKE